MKPIGRHAAAALVCLLLLSPAHASWDVFAQDFPKVERVARIPNNYKPKPVGSRATIVARITKLFPGIRFDSEGWATIEGPQTNLEVNIGKGEEVLSIAFHGRGGAGDVDAVHRILRELRLRAIDAQSGEFFSHSAAMRSHGQWRAYSDRATK